jgi:ABC-type branched-subunit amino acid transport system ATPase component
VVRRLARDVVVLSQGQVVHEGKAATFLSDETAVRRHLSVSA